MKDLDFDELDRAVSSLLGADETKKDTAAVDTSAPSDNTSRGSVDISEADEVALSSEERTSTVDDLSEKKPLVERRPAGRFMDVMHSSSDMKVRQKPSVPHQAVTIKPIVDQQHDHGEDMDSVEMPSASEDVDILGTPTVDHSETSDNGTHSFPDPLDFHNFSMEEPESVDTLKVESVSEETDDHELALEAVASELAEINSVVEEEEKPISVDTPFVNGSTIEKRPLGAFSVDTADTDPSLLSAPEPLIETVDEESAETEDAATTTVDTLPKATEEPEETKDDGVLDEGREAQTPLDAEVIPEELKGDIIAIEAQSVDQPVQSAVTGGSIQQQYTEKVQPQTDNPTPVFDTTQYHQPLKHTPKQKTGWLNVVLIILCIVVGVGLGAAAYFFNWFGV